MNYKNNHVRNSTFAPTLRLRSGRAGGNKLYANLFACILFLITSLHAFDAKIALEHTSPTQIRAQIVCHLAKNELLFHDSLRFSCNVPSIRITQWFSLKEPQTFFDPRSKKSHPVYSDTVTFTLLLESTNEIPAHALLHMHYQTSTMPNPQEKFFSLHQGIETSHITSQELTLPEAPAPVQKTSFTQALTHITTYVTNWMQDTKLPLSIKFVLAFIIGLFMSLTPCIYPMIPITMGILHANKAQSLMRGFLLASSYTAGLSTTFAILGMLAAFAGVQFGSFMGNPWIVIPIVIFFAYLGFSMLGFYEMYIPRFMQPKQGHAQNGSFLSAFTFGVINGTVASPCLSPGLALILGVVATMGNPVLGFLILFVFGIGSSFPLLIIGTFSSSMTLLPRAGMWMIEFKKVFGFLLLGMCIYYLKTFMYDDWVFYIALGTYLVGVAGYYLHHGFVNNTWLSKFLGLLISVMAAFALTQSYRVIWSNAHGITTEQFPWGQGYDILRTQAIAEKKLLLLDFTANWCQACKSLEKHFFGQKAIAQELPKLVVPVKIDCTDSKSIECMGACKKFAIVGFPTIVLVNPHDETVIRKWDSRLRDKDVHEFIAEIKQYHK